MRLSGTVLKSILGGGFTLAVAGALVVQWNKIGTLSREQTKLQGRLVTTQHAITSSQQQIQAQRLQREQDPRLLELDRLRGQVGSLLQANQRLKTEIARAKGNSPASAASANASLPPIATNPNHHRDLKMMQRDGMLSRSWSIKAVQSAEALQQTGRDLKKFFHAHPDVPILVDGQPNPELQKLAPPLLNRDLNGGGIVLLVANNADYAKLQAQPRRIIGYSSKAWPTPDGQYQRAYLQADGSVVLNKQPDPNTILSGELAGPAPGSP